MADKNKLSIYLIKKEFIEKDIHILKSDCESIHIENVGEVYFEKSSLRTPAWVNSFFQGQLDMQKLYTSNAKAILLCRVEVEANITRVFALTFGYGKNMLIDGVIEEDFGLRVVLNTITSESLRKISKTNIGGNQKISQEQMPLEADIDEFQVDMDRDLIGAITGRSEDESFVMGMMTGTDMLSLTASVNINNIIPFLKKVYPRYISNAYKEQFWWVDNTRRVRDKHVIGELDNKLFHHIKEESPKVWMAVPEVIEWDNIKGFKYCGNELQDDIEIEKVVDSLKKELSSIDPFKSKTIYAIREDNGERAHSWNAYSCIYAEMEYKGAIYCINKGKWFCIDKDFADSVNEDYEKIPVSEMTFRPYFKDRYVDEGEYTKAIVDADPGRFLLMDAKPISYGGGHSKIELCDALTVNGEYIHIKKYKSSAVLSHLFNQAFVSTKLIKDDKEFREKANSKIREQADNKRFLINDDNLPTIILAIISKNDEQRPRIPFFSKLALKYVYRDLRSMGCKIYIKNIKEC